VSEDESLPDRDADQPAAAVPVTETPSKDARAEPAAPVAGPPVEEGEPDQEGEPAEMGEPAPNGEPTTKDQPAKKGKPAKKARPAKKAPAWKPPPPERLEGAIEALLLVSGDVVRPERLRDLLGLPSIVPIREALEAIAARWAAAGLAVELEEVGGGVRVVTRPEYGEYVARLIRRPASDKLSRTLLETLCIVAYKQPVARAEVERIRGVQAGDGLRQLLERRLLKVVGRSDQPGRPLLYGTTQSFLTAFGLKDIKDLPAPKDIQRL